MPGYVTIPDFIKIGIMAMLFIWGANKVLALFNLDTLRA